MKAVFRSRYGSPDVLEIEDVRRPAPKKKTDVVVRVVAASVNAADVDYMRGLPYIARLGTGLIRPSNQRLGLDVAGQVEAVGRGVTRLRPGDEVFGDMTEHGFGAFAEYVRAPEGAFAPKPASLTFEQAATVPQSGTLAIQGLGGKRRIHPGDAVLINGAGGNVGPFAVQIAKAIGAEVTAVDTGAKLDMLTRIGADHVIDYTIDDVTTHDRRYDRILDMAGHRSIFDWRRVLASDGVYVMIGGATGRFIQAALVGSLLSLTGNRKLGLLWWWKPFKPGDIASLEELIETGALSPVIDRTYPLSRIADALRYQERGQSVGKIVIQV